ncbi:MAG: hypothetical protein P4L42_02555 [Desulfocapsaceae bacterium]|nr:hypothetical protein [Desulfocapsaceae bacterium]
MNKLIPLSLLFYPLLFVQPGICQDDEGCHFNTENAIICASPRKAALAFQYFGFDAGLINMPLNQQVLRELGCRIPYTANYKDAVIRQVHAEVIDTPSGPEPVISAIINGKDRGYIAQRYLDGACRRYKPEWEDQ